MLFASVLPLAIQAPSPAGKKAGVRPAAWLQAQVSGVVEAPSGTERPARSAFDRALAEARAAEAPTLHGFLATFLDAHARLIDIEAPATEGRSSRALIAKVRQQLVQAGFAVRPPTQMSAPPTAPRHRARWAAASLLVPFPDRSLAAVGAVRPPAGLMPALVPLIESITVPVVRGLLFRTLFVGRRLGP